MTTDLKKLKTKRGNIKRKLTCFSNLLNEADPIESYDEVSRRLEEIKDILTAFEDIQIEITLLEDTQEQHAHQDEFEDAYYTILKRAHKFLKQHAPAPSQEPEPTIINTNHLVKTSIRLPKIDLPSFSGAYDQWICFYDTFKSMVHTAPNYSDITKFHYLRSCLKDEAATIIESLEISESNYEIAWSLLIERYDNRRVIVQNHLKALLEQQSFNRESASNVRQILDNINKHTRALKALGQPIETWDTILIYCMTAKLNKFTHQEWEKSIKSKELPTLKDFLSFLTSRSQILEATELQTSYTSSSNTKNINYSAKKTALNIMQKSDYCILCKGEHKINLCEEFTKLSPPERFETIKNLKACFNCFRKNHLNNKCMSTTCKKCNKKHHTMLHFDRPTTSKSENPVICTNLRTNDSSQVILATAKIFFFDAHNKKQTVRVVLDGGAQANFISEKLANLLKLKRDKVHIPVVAINNMETTIQHKVVAKIASINNNYEATLKFLVVPRVSSSLPSQQINSKQLNIPKNLPLADPTYYKTNDIDALIGAELFYKILCVKQLNIQNEDAILQKTKFGWVIAGRVKNDCKISNAISCNLAINTINNDISRFWELEEVADVKHFSKEESEVENHFLNNVKRVSRGRYIVKLPFNDKKQHLGESYSQALKRFHALEGKLNKNSNLKTQYIEFMKEYSELGHMSVSGRDEQEFFLPHHAVFKESSATTKVRVVFDGSAKTSTGISLNDTLMIGPNIQDDIFSILVRSRCHKYLLIADIKKMYRQILIDEEDRRFQKILWRENSYESIKIYTLNTVTYGTAAASYLAIRALQKLAEDEGEKFPLAASIVKQDFYVDDLLTGSDSIENALRLRDDINSLLKLGGFELCQWSSNEPKLVASLPSEIMNVDLFKDPSKTIKTLGVQWNSEHDTLVYSINDNFNSSERATKRIILSNIAQLFDPIGLLGPIIVNAKLIMQDLWKAKLDWDESLPLDIHSQWINYKKQLHLLNNIHFERQLLISDPVKIQLHGFCDSSERAYGACIYLRSINQHGECTTRLVCSKSKVAPLNSKTTIPKLELCAALLLSKLYKNIQKILPITINNVYFWSDSTITLNWINTQPYILKTFVANRVSEIRNITHYSQWKHVPTQDNPADSISRGQSATDFLKNSMWRYGPQWLSKNETHWPSLPIKQIPLIEVRKTTVLKIALTDQSLLNRFSSIKRMIRVLAYCIRFTNNISKNKQKLSGFLSLNELKSSKNKIIKLIQQQAFSHEINNLSKNVDIDSKSSLKTLNPFLDKDGIIRVGGRIQNAHIAYDGKHPIVLPKNNHVTDLIIKHEHEVSLHAGIQNTLYQVRCHYWPVDGKNTTKRIVHACVKCARFRQTENKHVMGNLPENRIVQSRPFHNTGVDYSGPFFIKEKKFRNRNKVKVYVAIFVCFATKAVHLEVVSDLTTDAFLSSLRRFFSRRGKSKNIYSDNGTNFVGANNEIQKLYDLMKSDEFKNNVNNHLNNQGICWHFIPPRSPHFGGLWESAVKSFKNHFLRTVGNTLLTFEEFNTHVIEIEAILNSRPLTPLSNDPNDLIALTPAHFLISDSLTSVPDVDFSETTQNRLSNWQYLQQLKQHFWKRWHKEYLNQLNMRNKWTSSDYNPISIGTMVLVKEENLPPLQWQLGRIVNTHPGDDGVIRVISVKTANGIYKRSIKKIVILPIENINTSSK